MGLPGSGKTTLAADLQCILSRDYKSYWLNADVVRKQFNDWDFSESGRDRQAKRMKDLAELHGQCSDVVICDFVCPFESYRDFYDMKIWMNTIDRGRFEDTNKLFEKPKRVNYEIKDFNYDNIIKEIHGLL